MSKFIGRKYNIGIGKESVRGTGVASTYWLPHTELTFDEKIEQVKDESVMGVIENQTDADVVKKFAEGSLTGIVNDDTIGLVLYSTFGTVNTSGPSDSAYTHTFTVAQSAQHQSLTVNVSEPNATGSSSLRFPLTVIDSLELNFEVGQYPTYSFGFISNITSSTTASVSYTAPDNFRPQDGVIKIADTYANLSSGTEVSIRKANVNISKNVEDDHNIGSVSVTDRLNRQFQVTGSMELVYDARTFTDTYMLANLSRALQIKFTNTNKTIGASTNPSITFNFNKIKFQEVAKSIGNDEIVMQTVNFEGFYSIADSKMVECVLVNDVASY